MKIRPMPLGRSPNGLENRESISTGVHGPDIGQTSVYCHLLRARPTRDFTLSLASLLFGRPHGLDFLAQTILEFFPWCSIQFVAEFTEVVHLAPAVSSPFAARHVDDEISICFPVMDLGIFPILGAGADGEGINLSLWNERRVRPDPWLIDIEVLERILLLVLPFHMFLFVANRVPPDVEETIGPRAASDKERSQVEASTILRDDEIDRFGFPIADGGAGDWVKVVGG